jgi:hypothetical protein
MRPGYVLYRHPSPNDERDGWLNGYVIYVHGYRAPEFSLHKSKISECRNDSEYEELLCECADDMLQVEQDGALSFQRR